MKVFTGLLISLLLLPLQAYAAPLDSITPSPRVTEFEWMTVATWYRKHADDVEASYQKDIDLVFIGDSITESWEWSEAYQKVFNQHFGAYKSLNLGVGGDMTQNVLWRLKHGAKGSLKPKVVVLMIGVNNFGIGNQTPSQTALGVGAVIAQLRDNFPEAEIINLAILPYDQLASSPNRAHVKVANNIIAQFAQPKVHFYDFGDVMLDADGSISKDIMQDFLHPTPKGMDLLGTKLAPVVQQLMNKH